MTEDHLLLCLFLAYPPLDHRDHEVAFKMRPITAKQIRFEAQLKAVDTDIIQLIRDGFNSIEPNYVSQHRSS